MSKLPIIIMPDPILRAKAKPVDKITRDVEQLLDTMLETMYHAPGIGLAAPQVNVGLRIVTIDLAERAPDQKSNPLKIINPEIIAKSEEENIHEEGCLSIPGIYAEVTRPARVTLKYMDEKGKTQQIDADGLLATCIQHEIDHLNGVLFIDYLSKLKRDVITRKMKKLKAELYPPDAAQHNIL